MPYQLLTDNKLGGDIFSTEGLYFQMTPAPVKLTQQQQQQQSKQDTGSLPEFEARLETSNLNCPLASTLPPSTQYTGTGIATPNLHMGARAWDSGILRQRSHPPTKPPLDPMTSNLGHILCSLQLPVTLGAGEELSAFCGESWRFEALSSYHLQQKTMSLKGW